MKKKYRSKFFFFRDSNFNVSYKHVNELGFACLAISNAYYNDNTDKLEIIPVYHMRDWAKEALKKVSAAIDNCSSGKTGLRLDCLDKARRESE